MFLRSLFLAFMLSFSVSLFADAGDYGLSCITHGECQDQFSPQRVNACFIVKTGTSPGGEVYCSLRCYSVLAGNYCDKRPHEMVGLCRRETFQMPDFNPGNPDCSNAIDIPTFL